MGNKKLGAGEEVGGEGGRINLFEEKAVWFSYCC